MNRARITAITVTALALVALLTSCGSDAPEPTGISIEMTSDCQTEWDAYVTEWNDLVTERDANGAEVVTDDGQTYDTYADWAESKGYPASYEELCL